MRTVIHTYVAYIHTYIHMKRGYQMLEKCQSTPPLSSFFLPYACPLLLSFPSDSDTPPTPPN